jgi:hypothetical protein
MKKLFPIVVAGIFLLSFNPRPISHSLAKEKNLLNSVDSLNPILYALYLEKNEKDKFLTYLQGIQANNQKVIFQFFYKKDDVFTLALDTGAKGGTSYDNTIDFKLKVSSCPKIDLSTLTTGILFSNFEFDQKKDLNNLINVVTNNKIIVFVPELYTGAGQKNAIAYEICTCDNDGGICTSDKYNYKRDGRGATGIISNPSPPHGGN